jgi:hypothetical protein
MKGKRKKRYKANRINTFIYILIVLSVSSNFSSSLFFNGSFRSSYAHARTKLKIEASEHGQHARICKILIGVT